MNSQTPLHSPIEFFGKWAETGKDTGMEKGHAESVEFMLEKVISDIKVGFSFIDAGCGNGWVVRKMNEHPLCHSATGIDGAKQMIKKANSIDPLGNYICDDLLNWNPLEPVDVVHSMEVLYYLQIPKILISNIFENWLKPGGKFIFGIDHYLENPNSLEWPRELRVYMNTLSINNWIELMELAGFIKISTYKIGEKNDWQGTLVLSGYKPPIKLN